MKEMWKNSTSNKILPKVVFKKGEIMLVTAWDVMISEYFPLMARWHCFIYLDVMIAAPWKIISIDCQLDLARRVTRPLGTDSTSLDSFPSLSFSTLFSRVNLPNQCHFQKFSRTISWLSRRLFYFFVLVYWGEFCFDFLLGHLFSLFSPSRSFSSIFFISTSLSYYILYSSFSYVSVDR